MGESPKALLLGRAPILRVRGAAWAGGPVEARDAVPWVPESNGLHGLRLCRGGEREWRAGKKGKRGATGAASASAYSRSWREGGKAEQRRRPPLTLGQRSS